MSKRYTSSWENEVTKLGKAHYYFKLDPNIRNPMEVFFGKLEIEGLTDSRVEPIKHFYDILKNPPISYFDNETVRIQDFLLNLRTVYGNIQGYHFSNELLDLTRFVERLAYTREIYACIESEDDPKRIQQYIFPFGVEGKNFQAWVTSNGRNRFCLFRIVTNIFFLEQMNNVTLCSAGKTRERQIQRMNENLDRLTFHIIENIRNFVPKFPKDYNWKEFEDFVDEPNEITLYLTQFFGSPYKAKFHPRMIRALMNFAGVKQGDVTGDFMLGSGTLAIESVLQNLKTKGSDINPLTEIVTKAKISALDYESKELLEQIDRMCAELPEACRQNIKSHTMDFFKGKEKLRDETLALNRYIRSRAHEKYKDFFLCALASVISSAFKKRVEPDIFYLFKTELWKMWKLVYCLNQIKKFLHVPIGKAEIFTDDVRVLSSVEENSVDLIVTSPPYSTAIDYVKMDLAQLLLLELIESPKELDESMMGTHRKTSDFDALSLHITRSQPLHLHQNNRFHKLPLKARNYILDLKEADNMKTAFRCYKFLHDMWDGLAQMYRVLKPKGKCIIIIGNNVFTVGGEKKEFQNGDFLEEMALNKEIGFSRWREKLVRKYSKSSYGTILKEDIVFLQKA